MSRLDDGVPRLEEGITGRGELVPILDEGVSDAEERVPGIDEDILELGLEVADVLDWVGEEPGVCELLVTHAAGSGEPVAERKATVEVNTVRMVVSDGTGAAVSVATTVTAVEVCVVETIEKYAGDRVLKILPFVPSWV